MCSVPMISAMAIIHAKTKLLVLIGDSISWNDYIWFMEDTSPWKLLDLVMTKTHWVFKRLVTGKLMDVGHESLCFDVDNHPEHM